MVRVSLEEMVKSPLTAGDTGLADTVKVTTWEEGPAERGGDLGAPAVLADGGQAEI